ncbi:MAG: CopD family protein [Ilumatobacteraceae bacterium]|nr:CopD family protein [Ilumatobacteraceae bacterium]
MSRTVQAAVALVLGFLVLLAGPLAVSAHTGIESSVPANGSSVEGPLGDVILTFTGTPTAIDDGILVADAAGTLYAPIEITQDGLQITAHFDPPLGEGSYALAWTVRSDDTHTIDGELFFAVTLPVPTTSLLPSITVPTTVEQVVSTLAPETTVPPTPETEESPATSTADAIAVPPVVPDLDGSSDGEDVSQMGRLLLFPSAVVAVGILGFAALAFAGRREELGTLIRLVRWLGVGVVLGALTEVVGLNTLFGDFDQLLDETAGRAAISRLIGGVLLVVGFVSIESSQDRASRHDPEALSAAVVDDAAIFQLASGEGGQRWHPGGLDWVGVVGAAVLVMSFAFDGHTLSEGPRLLHGLVSMIHAVSVSVWAGGVVALAVVLWRRNHDGVRPHALEMVLRFSVIAMFSLLAAGAAGVVMALLVDSDVGSYLSTEWGQLLLIKLAFVAVATALGAYNHFSLLPALKADPQSSAVVAKARFAATIEAGVLVAAAVVSALLVAASTL